MKNKKEKEERKEKKGKGKKDILRDINIDCLPEKKKRKEKNR